MKRLRLQVAAALLCCSIGWGGIAPRAAAAIPADVNADNVVNISDALLALRAAIDLEDLTPAQEAVADLAPRPGANGRLYGDGRVDVQDAIRILQHIVGLVTREQLAPAEPTALYTLNAGVGCSQNPSVTYVDLTRYFQAPQEAVTLNAFTPGSLPYHMAVRGNTGYLANSGDNTLQIIDLAANEVSATVDLGPGTGPSQVAVAGEKAYVTLLFTGEVAVVDLNRREMIGTIPTGSGATGAIEAGGKIYVTNTAFAWNPETNSAIYGPGTVSVIDPARDEVVNTLPVPINPQFMEVDPWGLLHVVSTGNYFDVPGSVTVFNPATDAKIGEVPIGGTPGSLTITLDGKAYLADTVNGVLTYDARTFNVLRGPGQAIRIDPEAWAVESDTRGRVYVEVIKSDKVVVLDSFTDEPITEIPVGPCPEAITVR